MADSNNIKICKSCGFPGKGNYCSNCGQSLNLERISIKGILHDILHFFTHIEKGFFYTLKQLIIAPGHMQRAYIEGKRSIHQKPFSMFFICATITALCRYWIFNALINYYHADINSEAKFFHEYMVLTFIFLTPVYTLFTYLVFYKTSFNYAEIGVLMLYTLSFIFLAAVVISLLKLMFPYLETRLIEFPIFTMYMTLTFINFFKTLRWWIVSIKSVILMIVAFLLNGMVEDFVIGLIS